MESKSIDDLQFDKTFKINVYGAFYMTKACFKHMASENAFYIRGQIIHII